MFERFTQKARAVVAGAQDEARRANVRYIGTEHLLASMLAIRDGRANAALQAAGITLEFVRTETGRLIGAPGPLGDEDAAALKSIGIDLDAVVESVERSFGPGALSQASGERPRSGHIPFTKRAKKVLELALREALRLDHDYIGTEHLLLGLIREGNGMAMKVLASAGVDVTAMRDGILADLGGRSAARSGIFAGRGHLTPAARDAIMRAGEEAQRQDLHYIGTEQILLALSDTGTGVAYTVLREAGLTAEAIRSTIAEHTKARLISFPEWRRNRGRPRFTPAAKKLLEAALMVSVRQGSSHIDTEHLLVAIIDQNDGLAATILCEAGVPLAEMRASLIIGLGEAA